MAAPPATPDVPLQTRIIDDKSPICIPFILSLLAAHKSSSPHPSPFFIGLNGLQGVGKTTLVRALASTLSTREDLPTLVLSIDDFYLPHADQLSLAASHPDNALVQYRGEPGTHDVSLAIEVLGKLKRGEEVFIPQYDKAAYGGLGDRVPESQWAAVNKPGERKVEVVILEGWCVGFKALSDEELEKRWREPETRTLHKHTVEQLGFVNGELRGYEGVTELLDAFIHVDAEDTEYVYEWRLEQERQLRRERGEGMSDEQVVRFVDAYYPAYELYEEGVRKGIFEGREGMEGRQLRLVVGRDRSVQYKVVI